MISGQRRGSYQDYLKAHPADPAILQRLGLVDYLADRYAEAILPLAEALRLDPSLWGSALYLGISYYRTNRFVDAICSSQARAGPEARPARRGVLAWSALLVADQPENPQFLHLRVVTEDTNWGVEAQSLLIKAYRKTAEDHYLSDRGGGAGLRARSSGSGTGPAVEGRRLRGSVGGQTGPQTQSKP